MDLLQDSRYKDKPVYIFFENYVLDCIGHLPAEKQLLLKDLNLQQVFATQSTNWKAIVEEVLRLSTTIELAISYEWYKQLERCEEQGVVADPAQFARDFTDAYFSENSTIDVWNEQTLKDAKDFVEKHQSREIEEV